MEAIIQKNKLTFNKTNIYLLNSIKEKQPLLFDNFLNEISKTALPDFTLLNIEKIISKIEKFEIKAVNVKILVEIASFSPFLVGIIAKNPDYFLNFLLKKNNLNIVKNKKDFLLSLEKFCSNVTELSEFKKKLRYVKQQEFLRIGVQDICKLVSLESTTFQLSDLAAAFLEYSIRWLQKNLFKHIDLSSIIILGMGKLAGKDLNFSSDIDLIYFYTNTNNSNKLKHIYINFFETLTSVINDITEDGFVFRVDLRLRPDGINGPIAMDIENAIFYYENFGRIWERGVLLKAFPVAGNIHECLKLLNRLKPFIYRRNLDFRVAEEILQMKQKINNSINHKDSFNNIKLGIGGIREIEFIMQAIQLIFGGKYVDIRERNCVKFFKTIKKYKFLSNKDVDFLIFAYKFLRNLEHKIQILHEKQTHSLPKNSNELKIISYYFGFKNVNFFLEYQFNIRKKVHKIFNNFIMFKGLMLKSQNNDNFLDETDKVKIYEFLKKYNLNESICSTLITFLHSLPEETKNKIKVKIVTIKNLIIISLC